MSSGNDGSELVGADAAAWRVRQARVAKEEQRVSEQKEAVLREAEEQAKAARVAEFQLEVKRRNAARQREKRLASEREAAEARERASDREARMREQAERAEAARRELAQQLAHKRANARRAEQHHEQLRQAEQVALKQRSCAEGAQLQAAAIARVRERRKQAAEQREQHEVQEELNFLAHHPEKLTAQARAREQRSAAVERLRMRKCREETGEEKEPAVDDAAAGGKRTDGATGPYGRRGPETTRPKVSARANMQGDDGFDHQQLDDDDIPGSGWMLGGQGVANVGFVIRGDPSPPVQSGPDAAHLRHASQRMPLGSHDKAQSTLEVGRCGLARRACTNAVACDGAEMQPAKHPVMTNPHGHVGMSGHASKSGPHQDAEPPQVLEIRSPARSSRQRFDPPPVEPSDVSGSFSELLPGRKSSPKGRMPAAVAGPPAGEPRTANTTKAGVGRRKPWQKAPVPLDRPLS